MQESNIPVLSAGSRLPPSLWISIPSSHLVRSFCTSSVSKSRRPKRNRADSFFGLGGERCLRDAHFEALLLDLSCKTVEPASFWYRLPCWEAAIKDLVHLFQSLTLGLGCRKEHVNESRRIKSRKYHVHLPVYTP